jgi:hypothetical protein
MGDLNLNDPNDTPINRVRKFLNILEYKRNDLNKYKKTMDEHKMNIKILLDKYKSQQHNITIHTQEMLVDIHDKYKIYKEAEDQYFLTLRKVENIKRNIENINIRPYINDVVDEFNFEL